MFPLHGPARHQRRSVRLAWKSPALVSALAMSVLASGVVGARQLRGDGLAAVPLVDPDGHAEGISGRQLLEFKLRTTAGYEVLVDG